MADDVDVEAAFEEEADLETEEEPDLDLGPLEAVCPACRYSFHAPLGACPTCQERAR